jgi:hypothetical protein
MLTGDAALIALEAQANQAEAGQSAYWRQGVTTFDVKADGTIIGNSVLGMVSEKTGPLYRLAHWLLQAPFRAMGARFGTLSDSLAIGRLIAGRQNRAYTYDLLRHSLTLALIRHYVPLDAASDVSAVIGDGSGLMASHLLLAHPNRKVVSVNLTKPLLLDLVRIRQAVPGIGIALVADAAGLQAALSDPAIRSIAIQADNARLLALAPIGLAVNIVSMQEMDPAIVADYFHHLRQAPAAATAFYCCNKLWKRLSDGTEVEFSKYPWRDADRVLLDEACGWSQWVYSKRPPFWHYRKGGDRVIWHRLAWLDKDKP